MNRGESTSSSRLAWQNQSKQSVIASKIDQYTIIRCHICFLIHYTYKKIKHAEKFSMFTKHVEKFSKFHRSAPIFSSFFIVNFAETLHVCFSCGYKIHWRAINVSCGQKNLTEGLVSSVNNYYCYCDTVTYCYPWYS